MYEHGFSAEGFEWIELNDHQNSVLSYIRKGKHKKNDLAVICNFTPVVRKEYRIGIETGEWEEILNTDFSTYWGSGVSNSEVLKSEDIPQHGRISSLKITIPPLGAVIFEKESYKGGSVKSKSDS